MTIKEALEEIDRKRQNAVSKAEKIRWLSRLDAAIYQDIILKHEESKKVNFVGYDEATPEDTQLIAQEPYDAMYIHWMESRIDYDNQEYMLFNNSNAAFSTAYGQYADWYNREHMPKGAKMKYF